MRAYFDAWERGDYSQQQSFMVDVYAGMAPEPAKSLVLLDVHEAERSAVECTFDVSFDLVVKGEGVSMTSGRYDWSYGLMWDQERQSWLITDYGGG